MKEKKKSTGRMSDWEEEEQERKAKMGKMQENEKNEETAKKIRRLMVDPLRRKEEDVGKEREC